MKFTKNREWTKQFKFNNHWYVLKSLFDNYAKKEFDFEKAVNETDFLIK